MGIGIREPMAATLISRPRGTGDYLFMYFHTSVRVGITETSVPEEKGVLYVWKPGVHQFYGDDRKGFLHSWLHCEGTAVDRAVGSVFTPHTPLRLSSPSSFEKFLRDLNAEISNNAVPDEMIGQNLFENWVRDMHRTLSQSTLRPPERLSRVKEFMDSHFSEAITLTALAKQANWSVAHFSEEFRRYYGTSPIDYIISMRMNHAAYLLEDINLSVTEVASRVGYENIYHFSKLFKRRFGASPRNSRRRL